MYCGKAVRRERPDLAGSACRCRSAGASLSRCNARAFSQFPSSIPDFMAVRFVALQMQRRGHRPMPVAWKVTCGASRRDWQGRNGFYDFRIAKTIIRCGEEEAEPGEEWPAAKIAQIPNQRCACGLLDLV